MKIYKQKGSEIIYDECPFCGNMKNNFQVNVDKGVYHCWVCDAKGPISKLNILLPRVFRGDNVSTHTFTPQKSLVLKDCVDVIGTEGEEYLKNRGFSLEDILCWGIRFSLLNRLVFPWYDDEDRLLYYVEKDIKTGSWNYPEGVSKKDILWVRFRNQSNDILIVEGIFDAMRVYSYGYNVLILLGTNVFDRDVDFIRKKNLNPILFLDSDCKIEVYKRIKKRLGDFECMKIEEGDPDELSKKEVDELFKNKVKFGLSDELKVRWK